MTLHPGRLKDLIQENLGRGSALTCHRTLYEDPNDGHAICRGFFDRFAEESPALRLAQEMNIIDFIDPPAKE